MPHQTRQSSTVVTLRDDTNSCIGHVSESLTMRGRISNRTKARGLIQIIGGALPLIVALAAPITAEPSKEALAWNRIPPSSRMSGATAKLARDRSRRTPVLTFAKSAPTTAFNEPMRVILVRSAEVGCEPRCPEWISAEGKIESASVDRFRKIFKFLAHAMCPFSSIRQAGESMPP